MIDIKFIFHNEFISPTKVNFHFHNCYELIFYINANGHLEYFSANTIDPGDSKPLYYYDKNTDRSNKDRFQFSDQTCILLPPYVVHNEVHNIPANLVAICFTIDDEPYSFNQSFQHIDSDYRILPIIQKISEEYRKKAYLYDKMIASLLHEILIITSRSQDNSAETINPMQFVKSHINEYFMTKLDIDTLASLSGYSPAHFRSLFKEYTGQSPKNYILNKRMDYAIRLLENTDLALNVIGEMCGFDDYVQFHVFFKKRSNMNPRQYRDKFK